MQQSQFVAKLNRDHRKEDLKRAGAKTGVAMSLGAVLFGPVGWASAIAIATLSGTFAADYIDKQEESGFPNNLLKLYQANFRVIRNDEIEEENAAFKLLKKLEENR